MTTSRQWLGASLLLVGCGAAQTATQPLGGETPEPARSSAQPAPPGEPVTLVLQVANPTELWPRLSRAIPAEGDTKVLLSLGVKQLAGIFLGATLAPHVETEAPLEVAAVGNDLDNPTLAVSLPIAHVAEALEALEADFEPTHEGAGKHLLHPRPEGAPVVFEKGAVCELWETSGNRGRLLCSGTRDALHAAGNYLSGQAVRAPETQLALWISNEAWKEAIAKGGALELHGATPEERLGEKMGQDLVLSMEDIRFGANLTERDVELSLSVSYPSTRAALPRMLLAHVDRAEAPKAFFALPDTVLTAVTTAGAPRGAFDAPAAELWNAIFKSIEDTDWDPKGTQELLAASKKLVFTGGPVIMASGLDVAAAKRQINDYLALPSPSPDAERALQDALSAWAVFAVPEPLDTWTNGIREILTIDRKYSHIQVLDQPGASAGPTTATGPVERNTRVKASPKTRYGLVFSEASPEKIAGLERPAIHFLLDQLPNVAFESPFPDLLATVPYTTHLFLAAAHGHTYLCVSRTAARCTAVLKTIAGNGRGTLGAAPIAARLRGKQAAALGVFSLTGFTALTTDVERRSDLPKYLDELANVEALPAGGTRPIAFFGNAEPRKASQSERFVFRVSVPLEEAIDLGKHLASKAP